MLGISLKRKPRNNMLYFLISWSLIGILSLFISGKAGLVASNMKDYILFILACGPLVWLILLASMSNDDK